MEDGKIIALYVSRDERAITETGNKYGAYCQRLAVGILDDEADAEEVVSDTWLRAWNSIPPQKPVVLKLFLAKITRNLALNRLRAQATQKRGGGEAELALEELEECIPARQRVEDALEGRELARAIQRFLMTQPQKNRGIFVRRYFSVETPGAIAAELGLTEANVRKILQRTRRKLKDYLSQEGYSV